MLDCGKLAHEFGRRVGNELGIRSPVRRSSCETERKNLSIIRRGDTKVLPQLKDPAWQPDLRSGTVQAKVGATVTGARVFLIEYNVNLGTNDTKVAKEIAETHSRER